MIAYIVRRLLLTVPVLIGVSVLVFMIIHLAPGDPAQIVAGPSAPQDTIEDMREQMGLNDPFYVQYGLYVGRVLQGDLGQGLVSRRSVADEIKRTFPYTVELVFVASLFGNLFAIPLGVLAAVKRNSFFDKASMTIAIMGVSFPIFFIGLVLLWFFAGYLQWLPLSGRGGSLLTLDGWKHILLPAVTLGYFQVAVVARVLRSSMLEVLGEDFVRTARAKGLTDRLVVYRHALRNALLPAVTVMGVQIGVLLGGAVVTETIFSWPGMGRLLVGAINQRDFPMVQGPLLVLATSFVVINLIVDIVYGLLDPRIRAAGS